MINIKNIAQCVVVANEYALHPQEVKSTTLKPAQGAKEVETLHSSLKAPLLKKPHSTGETNWIWDSGN